MVEVNKGRSRRPEQAAIARKLIEKIEVTPNGIVIHYHVGNTHYLRELDDQRIKGAVPLKAAENGLRQAPETQKGLVDRASPLKLKCCCP